MRSAELLQAIVADFIVVIQASAGSTAEVHDTGVLFERLGSKMIVFLDEKSIQGYSHLGLLTELDTRFKNVHRYRYPEDIEACNLLASVIEQVKLRRWAKWHASIANC
jgi:hypothetical protein